MKKYALIFLMLFFTFSRSFAQLIEPPPNSPPKEFYDYYMIKRQKNNTAAWICLGGGAGLFAIGITVGADGLLSLDSSKAGAGGGLMVAGALVSSVSIPLFISAGSNKRKARLSLESIQNKVGNIRFDNSKNYVVSLKIPLD
jgi:hypothetical protein